MAYMPIMRHRAEGARGTEITGWATTGLNQKQEFRLQELYALRIQDKLLKIILDHHVPEAIWENPADIAPEGFFDSQGVFMTGVTYHEHGRRLVGLGEQSWFLVRFHYRARKGPAVVSTPAWAVRIREQGLPDECFLTFAEVRLANEVALMFPQNPGDLPPW